MPTKAEHEAFRQKVVDVALAATDAHGWCSEVTRILREELGLGDLIAPEYWVQRKSTARSNWGDWTQYDDDEAEARKEALDYRQTAAFPVPDPYNYNFSNPDERTLRVTITPTTDLDEVMAILATAKKDVTPKPSKKKKAPTARAWPKYRVVKRTDADEVVYEPTDEELTAK